MPSAATFCRAVVLWVCLWPAWTAWANDPSAPLRLAVERDYAPFVFVDADGQPRGLSIDMLNLVLERAALRSVAQPAQPLASLLEGMRQGQADLITSVRATPERAQYLVFSRPYVEVPAILVLGPNASRAQMRKGLLGLNGQPVAVGKGYGVEAPMRKAYPEVDWQRVDDDAAALRGVADGRFAGAVADAASVAHLIRRDGLLHLQAAGRVGYDYPLSFALTQSRAALLPRIDKAIAEVPAPLRLAVIAHWMGDLDLDSVSRHPPWIPWIGGVLLICGLGVMLWQWRRSGKLHGG